MPDQNIEIIQSKIYQIRDQSIMLDRDLAVVRYRNTCAKSSCKTKY